MRLEEVVERLEARRLGRGVVVGSWSSFECLVWGVEGGGGRRGVRVKWLCRVCWVVLAVTLCVIGMGWCLLLAKREGERVRAAAQGKRRLMSRMRHEERMKAAQGRREGGREGGREGERERRNQ